MAAADFGRIGFTTVALASLIAMDTDKLQKVIIMLTMQLIEAVDKCENARNEAVSLRRDLADARREKEIAFQEREITLQNFECLVRDGRVKANDYAQLSMKTAELQEQSNLFQHTLKSIAKAAATVQLHAQSPRQATEFVARVVHDIEAIIDCSAVFAAIEDDRSKSPGLYDFWAGNNNESATVASV